MKAQSVKTKQSTKVSSPNALLTKTLQERGISQVDLAQMLGRTPQFVSDLIKGKKEFDSTVAIELEEALEYPTADEWVQQQLNYERYQRQSTLEGKITRRGLLQKYSFLADALKLRWIEDSENPTVLEVNTKAFLKQGSSILSSFKASERLNVEVQHLAAWQIRIFQVAQEQENVSKYSKDRVLELVEKLQKLLSDENGVGKVKALLQKYGIRFVIVPHIKKCPVDGVASYNNGEPYIGVSLRHGNLDRFWFVLMHELAHIFREHDGIRPDNLDRREVASEVEVEANQIAQNWLLDPDAFSKFKWNQRLTLPAIEEFAKTQGVHPAIVIGRLKNEGLIPWSKHVREHPSIREYLN
jgi:HTH-type transcriptional regulator / antitoxin HigA